MAAKLEIAAAMRRPQASTCGGLPVPLSQQYGPSWARIEILGGALHDGP